MGDYQVVAQIDTQYKSRRVVGFEYLPYQIVGSTWKTNAQLSFGPDDDSWSLTGFVRNLENSRILTAAPIFNIGGVGTRVTSAPRTYGVRANVRF